MDHADIKELIEAGDLSAARELLAARKAKRGISGEDATTLEALLADAASEEAPAQEPDNVVDLKPKRKAKQATKAPVRRSTPRRSAGRKGK